MDQTTNEIKKRAAVLYSDAKRENFPTEEQYMTEAEVFERAKTIIPFLEKIGYEVELIPGNQFLPDQIKQKQPFDFILNLVDSVNGLEYLSATIPATLELLNVPYIGTGMLGLSINSNKFLTKKLLEQAGVPLPRYQLFSTSQDPLDLHLKFPLISKLNEVHGSVAITKDSISENEQHLRAQLKKLMSVYHQPVLVEEFIAGKELTAYLIEGGVKKIYIGEKIFRDQAEKYKLATFDATWKEDDNTFSYQRAEGQHGILEGHVRTAFEVLKMDDYAKFDVRQDESGRYYFIDCNANPAFGVECAVGNILSLFGIDFEEVIRRLIVHASKTSKEINDNNNI
jgi:D-alanine-D-alanine ligase